VKREVRQEALNLLASHVQLVLDNCAKKEELERLTATIRPRAIALSTVHTVHRIVNSTLNLDELIPRLAHLISQVLRANRCAVYLADKTIGRLVCKALVGYPKNRDKNYCAAGSLEQSIAKTARIVLRKTLMCIPMIDEDVIGVITVSSKKDKKAFTYFDQEILTTLTEEAVIAIKNAQLYEEQKRVTLGTIQSLAEILGARIPNSGSPQVFLRLALKIAETMRLNEEETQALHYATLLKDTAKVGIPDDILKKPTKLTGEEYRLIREHPIKGAKIVQSFESLKPVVPIILYSREKYDGSGYPKGLKGEKIPLGARILSLINAFEALIIGRPYRDRFSLKGAFDEIAKNSGTQFDPKVVEAFLKVIRQKDFRRFLKHDR
jgi:response regulator RpfG family c-di-GMP phosphodiesterase